MACHLLSVVLARLFVLMCFMLASLQNVSPLLTFDRQTLLDIKVITEELLCDVQCGTQFASPLVTISAVCLVLCREGSAAKAGKAQRFCGKVQASPDV